MAEEKKKPAAKREPAKKKEMDLSLPNLNKMAIAGHKKRMPADVTSYNRRPRHPGRGQR